MLAILMINTRNNHPLNRTNHNPRILRVVLTRRPNVLYRACAHFLPTEMSHRLLARLDVIFFPRKQCFRHRLMWLQYKTTLDLGSRMSTITSHPVLHIVIPFRTTANVSLSLRKTEQYRTFEEERLDFE